MKKVFIILQFLILFALQTVAQNNWQTLSNAPQSWRLDDCYFINPQKGWAISPHYSYLTPNKFGQIWHTQDGGNTWQLQKDSSQTFYRSIGFADSLNGWVGNLADTSHFNGYPLTTDTIPLYYTTNGGVTWMPVNNLPNPKPKGICGISVVTDSVIYAYGRYYGPPVLIKTVDKGNTWTSTDMSPYATGLVDGYFFNKDTGFISGNNSQHPTILSTYDGGITWQTRYLATVLYGNLWKLSFPSRNVGYGSIEMSGATYFVKTIDGGITWTENTFLSAGYNEEGIGFINDSVGWIGGDDNGQATYKTIDGGNTWNIDPTFGVNTPPFIITNPNSFLINRFRRFGDTLMYASGNTMYKLNYDPSGINNTYANHPDFETYPNPFKKETTISYALPFDCRSVVINIYNMAGQKMISQNIGSQNVGSHQIPFSADLPQGVYYCTIITDEFQWTKKIVVIN